jgi:hypothetical protein
MQQSDAGGGGDKGFGVIIAQPDPTPGGIRGVGDGLCCKEQGGAEDYKKKRRFHPRGVNHRWTRINTEFLAKEKAVRVHGL